MNKEQIVIYKAKSYILVHEYSSGYCELRELGSQFNYELVQNTEITKTASETVHKADVIVLNTERLKKKDSSNKSTMLLMMPKNKNGLRKKHTVKEQ